MGDLDGGQRLSDSEARALLRAEVAQLRACEVRVFWPRDGWEPDERARLLQYLDDGAYVVELNPARPDLEQLRVLERVWSLWLEPNDPAWWVVDSAKPDDLDSLPVRYTTFLTGESRGQHPEERTADSA